MGCRRRIAGLALALAMCGGPLAPSASAEPAAAITPGNVLIRFDTAAPGTVTSTVPITGLGVNETVRGIDARLATGGVYINTVTTGSAANSVIKTYTLNIATGAATLVGPTPSAIAGAGDIPTGWDLNPVTDLFRYVNTNDENVRINPTTASFTNDTDLTPAATTTIIGTAFDRNNGGQTLTTQYAIDRNDSALSIGGGINGTPSPNGGVHTDLAPLGFNLNQVNDGGFDVSSPTGIAYAALTDAADNLTRLYRVTLVTGVTATPVATSLGLIGNGQTEVRSMTITNIDTDSDGVVDSSDNCDSTANPDQADNDGDGSGDACDDDDDNDGVPDVAESGFGTNPLLADTDGDGVPDGSDLCPKLAAATASGCNENPPPAAPAAPLSFTISGFPRTIKLRTLLTRGVSIRVQPNTAASFLAELRGNRGLRRARAGDVILAEKKLARAAGRRTMRLRVPRTQRRRIRRGVKLQLRVAATDALGRTSVRTRTLTVR